jgi:D-glycero-D-manno-heptose 1,7-bisphosphate phosphatase
MKRAIFLDRDGTLIEEVNYLSNFSQIKIFPFAYDAIKIFNELNFLVFIVTNQSGIARGFFNEEFVKKTNEFIIKTFNQREAVISDYFFCPHHPDDNCKCRKPETGMILKAKEKYNIDISTSYIIGDSLKDVLTGINAGMFPLQVLTGHGWNNLSENSIILPNLYYAALFIKNIESQNI